MEARVRPAGAGDGRYARLGPQGAYRSKRDDSNMDTARRTLACGHGRAWRKASKQDRGALSWNAHRWCV